MGRYIRYNVKFKSRLERLPINGIKKVHSYPTISSKPTGKKRKLKKKNNSNRKTTTLSMKKEMDLNKKMTLSCQIL